MAYSTSNPPALLVGSFNGTHPNVWSYKSEDGASDVDAAGYITNAEDLGMRVGDVVFVTDTNASPIITTTHLVSAISAAGAADLSNTGATLGSTNSG